MRANLSIGSKVLGTLLHGVQPGSVAAGAARAATAEPQALPARYPSRLNCVLKLQGPARGSMGLTPWTRSGSQPPIDRSNSATSACCG